MSDQNEMWAVIELMGHGQTAGIIRTSDLGGLLRVDVPVDEGFRTEYYGSAAIYSVKIVSEEIARAYAMPDREINVYDAPIVPRAQFEEALRKVRKEVEGLRHQNSVLENRLTMVNSLPAPEDEDTQIYEDAAGDGADQT